MHLNTRTKLKGHYECLWSKLLDHGLRNRCKRNIFFLNKQIILRDMQRFGRRLNIFFFIQSGKGQLLLLVSNSLIAYLIYFGSILINAGLLLFFCQLLLSYKQKHSLRHKYRLQSCLKVSASVFMYLEKIRTLKNQFKKQKMPSKQFTNSILFKVNNYSQSLLHNNIFNRTGVNAH